MKNDLVIKVKLKAEDINFFTKIFEGYDGLAVVTTIDGRAGLLQLTVTPQTKMDVLEILRNFPSEIIFQ
ncbi:MAG: DUF4911 domain-containing protein [Bacillota bacterium]